MILNIKKGRGTHFIRPAPTAQSKNLVEMIAVRNNAETVIKTFELQQEPGYLYFVDKQGDVSRTLQKNVQRTKQDANLPAAGSATASVSPAQSRRRDFVALLIDNSASMKSVAAAAHAAFNNILTSVCSGASDTQEIIVSIWSFGIEITQIKSWAPIHSISKLRSYAPAENGTRLFDAVETVLRNMDNTASAYNVGANKQDTSFVLTVVTDGHNNCGGLSPADFRKIIDQYQKTDKYTLTFMLPSGSKKAFCNSTGVALGNVDEWDLTDAGANKVDANTSAGFKNYWTARSTGAKSVKTFYTTDASKIGTAQLQKMTPITDQVSVFVANKEERLREFCERCSRKPLLRGAAFYQLIKDEKNVQASKLILIRDKSTYQIYSGREARILLGLPADADVSVKPGNHSNFDIFVQSTSVNRIIPRGTSVIYWTAVGVPYSEGRSAQ